ncbi:MAG: pitrilysin family protein [Planctomycetota bacterium]
MNSGQTSAAPHGALIIPRVRFELPGGAVLLVSRRPKAPVTAVRIHMKGGILTDPVGWEGLSEWVGGLLDQGTANMDEAAIADAIEPYGGSVAGDATGLRGSMAGDEWRRLLDVMFELVAQPRFPDGPVGVQIERLKTHMAVQEEDPRVQGGRTFRRLVYGDHRMALPNNGTSEILAQVSAADLRAHHDKNWCRARAIIAVCGDVDPEEVHQHLLRRIDDWNPGTPFERGEQVFPERSTRVEAFEKGREQVHVYFGHLGVERKIEDYPALVVMDHVLGSGPGFVNRLSKKLRDEQGLAYTVYGDIHQSAGLLPGMFTAYIGTSPEHVERAVHGIRAEVRAMLAEPVSQEELDMAKDYVTGSMVLGYERASRRAASLIAQEVHGFAADHLETLRQAYAAVTVADVQATAQRHLFPEAACLAAAGSVSTEALRSMLGA